MKEKMFHLISENYTELFKIYCKYQDKTKIKNSRTCEDVFNDKILYFMELDIQDPNLILLMNVIKSNRKDKKIIQTILFTDNLIEDEIEDSFEYKLKLLFIDYRPELTT